MAGSGRIFAIATIVPGAGRNRAVLAIDPEGGTWAQVADQGTPASRVSRDGRWLATLRNGEEDPEPHGIWLTDLTMAEPPRHASEKIGRPLWSPDGSELIVSGGEPGALATWRVKLDGSRIEPLPFGEDEQVMDWSHDGDWLLVLRSGEVGRSYAASPVYAVRPDGREARLLTSGHSGNDEEFVVRWQHRFLAGGSGVLYFTATESQCNLWRVDLDGGRPRIVLPERRDDAPFLAVGSPDGRRLVAMYFDRSVGQDGKKNDVIRGRHLEVHDLSTRVSRPIPLPDSEDLWILDWV